MSIITVPESHPQPLGAGTGVTGYSAGALRRLGEAGSRGLTRRGLQVVLGVFWILDGLLQLQPYMLSRRFATQILAPSAQGQPGWVAWPVLHSAHLVGSHPVPLDLLFAAAQLALGTGLLVRRTARLALAASVAWAAGVWFVGEGLGGIAGGTASFLTGAPGAALLYGLLAVAAFPRTAESAPGGTVEVRALPNPIGDGQPAADWFPAVWAALWVALGLSALLPANRSASVVAAQLRDIGQGVPAWLGRVDQGAASLVGHGGAASVVLLAGVPVIIGLCGLAPGGWRRAAAVAGIVMALVVWVVGQSFGQLASSSATDPNTGPLLVVAAFVLIDTVRQARDGSTSTVGA